MRISLPIYRLWKMFGRSVKMFCYFCCLFMPVFLGTCFLGHAIYSPYAQQFSTWTESFMTLVLAIRDSIPAEYLYHKGGNWTILFVAYFFFCIVVFLLIRFLLSLVIPCLK